MIDIKLFRDVLVSEWTKLRTVRSTYWSVLLSIVLGVGLGAAISAGTAASYSDMSLHDRLQFDPAAISLAGLFFSQLALGVFAIMTVSAEYSTGMIRTTLTAVPQRGYVLAAKATLVAAVSMITSIGVAFAAFSIGQSIFARHHLGVSLGDPGVARAVLGGGLYIGALTLLALGLATIIRHTAGAITGLVALVFIIPIVTQLLPDSLQRDFSRYLPANAGSAITNVVQTPESLGPWTGYAVFLGWTVLVIGIGYYLLRTRDV
ncbi:MAG TPA: ABC transporter permease subunit, partial [Mycobacteriales bacterium]|nr:ABC transporter permease subunit [Mycobacteriales bacterium]